MAHAPQPLDQRFLTGVVAGVASRLEQPTNELPSVRCIARPMLVEILLAVRDELAIPGHKRASATTLLALLHDAGIAHVVPLQDRAENVRKDRLYAIGFGVARTDLDPVELLQAHEPDGVVCYFTALALLGLTTQIPAHHHIALLVGQKATAVSGIAESSVDRAMSEGLVRARASLPPLGSKVFSYQGIPYYTTRREDHRVVGVQTRYVSEKSRYRVTTIEQSLIDTLHRPHSCGGPAVVFEVWSAAERMLDGTRLVALMRAIGDARLARRVGYMLSQFAPAFVDAVRDMLPRGSNAIPDVIPLFTGIPPTSVDHTWKVGVP
jgi:hypothetical protein